MQTSNSSFSKSFDRNSQNLACEFSFVCQRNCSMLLLLSIKEVVKLQSRLSDFVLKFQVEHATQFLRKTKFSNLPLEFCKSMQRLWSTSKKKHLAASHRHLVGTDFSRRCLGMSPKPATAQLLTVPRPCFSKMVAKDHRSGQVSPVQFSCTKKLLMKPEVDQCYHAFQEDFVI